MNDRQPGHGLDDFLSTLNELDGKRVIVRAQNIGGGATAGSPGATRRDIEDIAAEVYDRKTDYQQRRR